MVMGELVQELYWHSNDFNNLRHLAYQISSE
jgi:hypothetical protein